MELYKAIRVPLLFNTGEIARKERVTRRDTHSWALSLGLATWWLTVPQDSVSKKAISRPGPSTLDSKPVSQNKLLAFVKFQTLYFLIATENGLMKITTRELPHILLNL